MSSVKCAANTHSLDLAIYQASEFFGSDTKVDTFYLGVCGPLTKFITLFLIMQFKPLPFLKNLNKYYKKVTYLPVSLNL